MRGPLARLSMSDIVKGFGALGHNLQEYINQLTDSVGDVAEYHVREEDGFLCVYYVTFADQKNQQDKWQQLVDLLEQADALQQQLLGTDHPKACYEFHNELNRLADEFTDWANQEGYIIA